MQEYSDSKISLLGARIQHVITNVKHDAPSVEFVSLMGLADEVRGVIESLKNGTDTKIRGSLNLQVNRDRKFIDELAAFIDGLGDAADDTGDQDDEDDDDTPQPRTGRAAAVAAYMQAVRAQARAQALKRSIAKTSRDARIIEWLGDRTLPESERLNVGQSLLVQSAARKFINPIRSYIARIPSRYRRFRRLRQNENRWYKPGGFSSTDVDPLEVDLVLLVILRAAGGLIKARDILRNINDPAYATLKDVQQLYRNQVFVDEATDFSPVQLACMAEIANPEIRSFFACGDFNQRITNWGTRSIDELNLVIPNIDIRKIVISYRQTRQLSDLARQIVLLSGGPAVKVLLPEHVVDNQLIAPVMAKGLSEKTALVNWLAQRIVEIEGSIQQLPSIAILVNSEEEVRWIAADLNKALTDKNIRVVACPNGQVIGQDSDVRVFDVQHIKGLEFEAVFFVGVDQLVRNHPKLFDKYLYVGTTRAATYLGITCADKDLPSELASLLPMFGETWK